MSYLALRHVFTANLTDNTVLAAIWGGRRNAIGGLPSMLAVLGLCLGGDRHSAVARSGDRLACADEPRVAAGGRAAGRGRTDFRVVGDAGLPASWARGLTTLRGVVMGMQSAPCAKSMRRVYGLRSSPAR